MSIRQTMLDNEKIIRKGKGCYTMMKESIYQDIAILKLYAPNNKASKYMGGKTDSSKKKIDKPAIIFGDLTFFSQYLFLRTVPEKATKAFISPIIVFHLIMSFSFAFHPSFPLYLGSLNS